MRAERGSPFIKWSIVVDRAKKEAVVAELEQIFNDSGVVVVAHYTGLSVAEMSDLRLRMRKIGGAVRVAKNKLVIIDLRPSYYHYNQGLVTQDTLSNLNEL